MKTAVFVWTGKSFQSLAAVEKKLFSNWAVLQESGLQMRPFIASQNVQILEGGEFNSRPFIEMTFSN